LLLAANELVQRQSRKGRETAEGWLSRTARYEKNEEEQHEGQENCACKPVARGPVMGSCFRRLFLWAKKTRDSQSVSPHRDNTRRISLTRTTAAASVRFLIPGRGLPAF
jgi:hypothetical protein